MVGNFRRIAKPGEPLSRRILKQISGLCLLLASRLHFAHASYHMNEAYLELPESILGYTTRLHFAHASYPCFPLKALFGSMA